MASFFLKFLTGGAVAGGLTLYYANDIERTTNRLTSDLQRLSQTLVQSTPVQQPSEVAPGRTVIPQRLPFTEELKARWNEQLGSALHSLQTTSYSDLFSRTFAQLQSAVSSAQASAGPAQPPVEVQQRQV
ncbi:hypothetical protein JCM10213_009062 [Rhodosporidiobolus nylandii]